MSGYVKEVIDPKTGKPYYEFPVPMYYCGDQPLGDAMEELRARIASGYLDSQEKVDVIVLRKGLLGL